jgi:hypothetical protein
MKNSIVYRSIAVVMALVFVAVMVMPKINAGSPDPGVQKQEQVNQLENQKRLVASQPAPQLDYSVERQNLAERMKRLNDRNLIGYIYLTSLDGKIVASYVTKGKVTSLNSYLTGSQTLINRFGNVCGAENSDCWAVESPDYDGSYGENPQGIFFFTDTGAMVEWSGTYIWTDQPLSVKTPVSLVREIK